MVHDSLTSGGERGFPVAVSQFLATRYGYDAARVPAARERCREVLELMLEAAREGRARGSRYLIGDSLTAADIYAAVALAPFAPLEDALSDGPHGAQRVRIARPDDDAAGAGRAARAPRIRL
jgi:glutathione S-transferase